MRITRLARYWQLTWLITLISMPLIQTMAYASPNPSFTLMGKIVDEQAKALSNVMVSFGEHQVTTDERGRYSLSVPKSDTYQVSLTKNGYFKAVQTFSHHELKSSKGTIGEITLVGKAKERVMLAFAGDVMMGRRYYKPYFGDPILINEQTILKDSKAIVEHIKPYMALADYAAVNLETQLAEQEPSTKAKKSVVFYSKPQILSALEWAGVDYVSLGNNHTYDYLDSGLASTLTHLAKSNLGYSGAGKTEAEALQAYRQTINGQDYAMLGYVGWEGGGKIKQTANSQQGGAAYGSGENINAGVRQQVSNEFKKNRHTIVQYHGSQEYADFPTGVTEQRLKSALDNGAALAIAHHPHVAQGLELYNNKLIAYSMGNFIFDQNFASTQHSYILYVWLDDGQFHRAEIVPLYVKGYMPTPATGQHRQQTLKRIARLSQKHGTMITASGGHGIITNTKLIVANQETVEPVSAKQVSMNLSQASISHLTSAPWALPLNKVTLPEPQKEKAQIAYRLGTNLINGSDFESFATFTSDDRGWFFNRAHTSLNDYGFDSDRSLALSLTKTSTKTDTAWLGMQSFKRVYRASQPMTISTQVKTANDVKVKFYWQGRKTRQKLFDAFNNSPKHLIKEMVVSGDSQWQSLAVDFNSPRIGYKSYRVLAEFIPLDSIAIDNVDNKSQQIDIDDFSLIEWQTAFTTKEKPNLVHINSEQANFIGFNQTITGLVTLEYRLP